MDLTLAGLGSRFGAAIVDLLIQGALLLAAVFALTLAGSAVSSDFAVFLMGIGALVFAAIVLGYYLVFEALNGGRTPGKAAFGIRVASVDGSPVTMSAVAIRTLMRLVDFMPGAYAAGAISVLVTGRNQRLGDLAANTVVIRERVHVPSVAHDPDRTVLGWDVSAIGDEQLAVVRRYVARREQISLEARYKLAREISGALRPRVRGGDDLSDDEFLIQVLAEKEARR